MSAAPTRATPPDASNAESDTSARAAPSGATSSGSASSLDALASDGSRARSSGGAPASGAARARAEHGKRPNAWIVGVGSLLCVAAALLFVAVPWNGPDLARLAAAEATLAWHGPSEAAASGLQLAPRAWEHVWRVGAGADGWLAGAWTTLSRVVWSGLLGDAKGGLGERAAWPFLYRWENLALLFAWALSANSLVRRVATPWFGREHARAAAATAFLLLLAHPLAWIACSGLAARGALLAGALGSAALALFLRARQERRVLDMAAALVCAVLAGASHAQAWLLPLCAAGVEFAASRRYRHAFERLRTSGTTFVCASAAVGIEPLLRALAAGGIARTPLGALSDALRDTTLWSDAPARLAWQLFPANLEAMGSLAALLAAALWLCALQPALLASRHAPRLWGGGLACIGLALVVSVLVIGPRAANPHDLSAAHEHLAALPWLACALALCSTALSGRWRVVSPLLACGLCAALSFVDLRAFARAGAAAQELGSALERTRTLYGAEARYVVIDPPRTVGGVLASGADLAALLDPTRGAPPRVDGVASDAFLAWLRSREFQAQREHATWIAIVRASALSSEPRGADQRAYVAHVLPQRASGAAPFAPVVWRGDGRSPDLAVDPTRVGLLRVAPIAGTQPDEAIVSWRASNDAVGIAHARGALDADGASFDLSESLAWRLSGEVRRVWLEGPLVRMREAVLEVDVPLVLRAARRGDELVIDGLALPIEPSARRGFAFTCEVLDPARIELARFEAVPELGGTDLVARLGRAQLASDSSAWLAWRDGAGESRRARIELAP